MPTSDAPTAPRNDSILFLSGAGLPTWIWDGTAEILAPNYTAAVAQRPARKNPGLRDYARAALASAEELGPSGSFVVVAHSAGGVVATEMLKMAPERVSALLAVSAIVPKPGKSFFTSLPWPNRAVAAAVTRIFGTRPPDSAIAKTLADRLSPELTNRIQQDFQAESPHLYRNRVRDYTLPQRRGYVVTTKDREFTPRQQENFATNFNYLTRLDTGHLPMLEDPRALAREITRFLTS